LTKQFQFVRKRTIPTRIAKGISIQIAFVVPDDATAWLYYSHLVKELIATGNEVTVLSAPGPYVPDLLSAGAKHVAIPYARFVAPLDDLRLYRSLRREFDRNRFDVVQNFTVKANLYGTIAASRSGVPTIINTVEGAGILWTSDASVRVRLMRRTVETLLRAYRRVVFRWWFVNEHDRNLFIERGLCSAEQAVVAISTGVDTDVYNRDNVSSADRYALRQEIGIDDRNPVITMVAGRLLKSKGVEAFIELARDLKKRGVKAQAVLVGPEELDHPDSLDPSIVKSAVDDGSVTWIGFRRDIAAIYAITDVAVVPTIYAEGIAKSVVEAMAMSCPVVCARTPAIAEMVQSGVDAIVVPPSDPVAIADAVGRFLGDRHLSQTIGRAARKSVLIRFDAKRQAHAAVRAVYGLLQPIATVAERS
jgi:glycosyltransferase involved in cell wall biosynthesis